MIKWIIIKLDKLNMNLNKRILCSNNKWKHYKILFKFIDHKKYWIK